MKHLVLLATLMITPAVHAQEATAPISLSQVVSINKVVAIANTTADYTDGIMFVVIYADGSAQTQLVHRNRLQREPSVATFSFDPAKTRPLHVLASTLRSVYAARSDVR
jgi:hypothetical protein